MHFSLIARLHPSLPSRTRGQFSLNFMLERKDAPSAPTVAQATAVAEPGVGGIVILTHKRSLGPESRSRKMRPKMRCTLAKFHRL